MKIIVNGNERDVEAGTSVMGLVNDLGLDARNVAVEINREIVKKAGYASTVLGAGDRIEIVHFVGGG